MNFISIFTKRKRRQGPFAISQAVLSRQVDQAIDDIRALHGIPDSEEEKIKKVREDSRREIERMKRIRPSTVEQKMADIKLEKSLFRGWDLPGFRIAEHNQKQGRELRQSHYIMLFNICIGNNIRTVQDLNKLDDETRDTLLSRTIDKVTFLKMVRICQEIQRDAPIHPGITRSQFISSRMHKIFI